MLHPAVTSWMCLYAKTLRSDSCLSHCLPIQLAKLQVVKSEGEEVWGDRPRTQRKVSSLSETRSVIARPLFQTAIVEHNGSYRKTIVNSSGRYVPASPWICGVNYSGYWQWMCLKHIQEMHVYTRTMSGWRTSENNVMGMAKSGNWWQLKGFSGQQNCGCVVCVHTSCFSKAEFFP